MIISRSIHVAANGIILFFFFFFMAVDSQSIDSNLCPLSTLLDGVCQACPSPCLVVLQGSGGEGQRLQSLVLLLTYAGESVEQTHRDARCEFVSLSWSMWQHP